MNAEDDEKYLKNLMNNAIISLDWQKDWKQRIKVVTKLVNSADVNSLNRLQNLFLLSGRINLQSIRPVKLNETKTIYSHFSLSWKNGNQFLAFDENTNGKNKISKTTFYTCNPQHFKPIDIDDLHYTRTRIHIEKNWGGCNKQDVIDEISVACYEKVISPVRHHL